MESIKGKKVHSIKENKHLYNSSIVSVDINFTDGTVLHVTELPHSGIRMETRKGEHHIVKRKPWRDEEQKFLSSLSDAQKAKYAKVRKAFFWLVNNKDKIHELYTYRPFKNENKDYPAYSISVSTDKRYPERILTLFLSSNVAPECDSWMDLGTKKHWKYILDMCENVQKGKKDD